jgi:magnesium-transporting ATPase (P-type)
MIVSVCLSKGALAMSKNKVIVKQLSAIQNFGAMDVLCTDKTGTLTMDQVILERHCDVMQKENTAVLRDAFLIAHFQTGLKNVLDRAVLRHRDAHEKLIAGYRKVDEIPFDFVRRMMSVVVEKPDGIAERLPAGKQNTGLSGGFAGPTATAGGLVFYAALSDRRLRAFDSMTGKELWSVDLGATATMQPMSYLGSDRRQYVAVVSGGTVKTFALPR